MTMIVQLVILACACALGVGAQKVIPPYMESQHQIDKALKLLQENVLSLNNSTPNQKDPKLQFSLIIHFINLYAEELSLDTEHLISNYDKHYVDAVSNIIPEALSDPQLIVQALQSLINVVHYRIDKILALTRSCVNPKCDQQINDIITKKITEYEKQVQVFLKAGKVATKLNKDAVKFKKIANALNAVHYFPYAQSDLKEIIVASGHFIADLDLDFLQTRSSCSFWICK